VDEFDWQTSTHLPAMLDSLRSTGRKTDRKLRLFSVACCRGVWHLLTDPLCRQGVEAAEKYADDPTLEPELFKSGRSLWAMYNQQSDSALRMALCLAAATTTEPVRDDITASVSVKLRWSAQVGDDIYCDRYAKVRDAALSQMAALLRDIFPNPFRPLVAVEPSWLTGTVLHLAQAIYDDRELPSGCLENGQLAVLADALEDAGCTNQEILEHCRGGGEHYRGCLVVDALLQRE